MESDLALPRSSRAPARGLSHSVRESGAVELGLESWSALVGFAQVGDEVFNFLPACGPGGEFAQSVQQACGDAVVLGSCADQLRVDEAGKI